MIHNKLLAKIVKIAIPTVILSVLNIAPSYADNEKKKVVRPYGWTTEDTYGTRPIGGWTVANIPFYALTRDYLITQNHIIKCRKQNCNDTK